MSPILSAAIPPKLTVNKPSKQGDWIQTIKQIKRGDTLYSLLKGHSFSKTQVQEILRQRVFPKSLTLSPGAIYQVRKNDNTKHVELKIYDLDRDISYVFQKKSGKAQSKRVQDDFSTKIFRVEGKVVGSLLASIKRKVKSDWIGHRFIDAYVVDHNLRKEVHRGAPFSIVFEAKYDGPHFIKFGEVLHTTLDIGGQTLERTFLPLKEGGVFVSPQIDHSDRPLYAPVDYLHFSSLYRPRRFHPIKKRYQAHRGIDFALPKGEPIYAAQSGLVLRKGRNRAAGRYVVIRHSNGIESYYNHLSAIADNVKAKQRVRAGEVIGYIGCSGYCTKPHLHFAVKKHGRFVNPMPLIKGHPYRERHKVENLHAKKYAQIRGQLSWLDLPAR
jgi:murein DD-endopeptidase MepM/ murein hydrolase activator NlpD